MKKIVYIVVGLLLFSGLATIGISEEAGDNQETISLTFSGLEISDSNIDSYIEMSYSGADGCLYQASAPVLPMYSTKMTFPFGTDIQKITAQTGQVKTMELSSKIVPAPTPAMVGIENAEGGVLYLAGEKGGNDHDLIDGVPCSMCARAVLNAHLSRFVAWMADGSVKEYTKDELKVIADKFDVSKEETK